MRPRRLVDVDIDGVAPNGDGLATSDRVRVAIPFTIPGERVRAELGAIQHGQARGKLVDVLRPSPHRVAPACAHFGPDASPGLGPCGGCTWQHIAYPEQLRLKTRLVDQLVRAEVPDAPAVRAMLPATAVDQPWGYRNKVHFVFGIHESSGKRRGGYLVMGHYARGSRRVIPVVECPVHDERGNRFAFNARDYYAAAVEGATAAANTLRGIAIRVGCQTKELMATLVVRDDRDRRVRAATRRLLEYSPPTSMHLNVHPRDDAYVFGRETRRLQGASRMREQIGGATFLTSPTAFFQTNVRAAELLVRLVIEVMPRPSRVLDLYAGSGLFAIPLALAGHEVLAIEENREAVADGEAALKLNGAASGKCRFMCRRVESALRSVRAADLVVLDPPREGCAPAVLDDIGGRLRPQTIVYVSCNPEALAAELRFLRGHGYRIRSLQPVDMFPHSAHIETVAVLDLAAKPVNY